MRADLVTQLRENFPALLGPSSVRIECGSGWFSIIEVLCVLMEDDANGLPEGLSIAVLKEKFGELRIQTSVNHPQTTAWAEFARRLSIRVCEVCGSPGSLVTTDKWARSRCTAHGSDVRD